MKYIIIALVVGTIGTAITLFVGHIISYRRACRPEFYRCCEHCGINFPSFGESYCERVPDSHLEPCAEPGFCTGKELANPFWFSSLMGRESDTRDNY